MIPMSKSILDEKGKVPLQELSETQKKERKKTMKEKRHSGVSHRFCSFNWWISLCFLKANTTRQSYHEGQRGEEEADDQFDVRLVAHHHAHSLAEGNKLGFFPRCLCHPKKKVVIHNQSMNSKHENGAL